MRRVTLFEEDRSATSCTAAAGRRAAAARADGAVDAQRRAATRQAGQGEGA
ncbi:hypothetical protein [Enterococcus faecalis]|uniref:hypothetical protein n=1 Tax=Enterococcus faecalis TaxID=1351 RepID=UPI003D6B104C